jgi:SpoVK/Ycf46/Vps4 family AAA+-type ATPase
MIHNTPKSFIKLLDDYKNKKTYTCSDYHVILQLAQFHYDQNCVGPVSRRSVISTLPTPHYYSLFGNSTWNSSISDQHIDSTHPFQSIQNPQATIPIPIEEITINVSINTFSDLITMIQTTEYRPYAKYNIDLKALVQVKEELLQLDNMIGMTQFKNSLLNQLLYFVQGLHRGKDPDFMHTVLSGPPGTGKTEVAILLGKIYSKIGVLKNRVFKKATRSDLVAGYLGQTAIKTSKIIQDCLGGCLFIDEAYSLGPMNNGIPGDTDSYSKECLDTLCEALSAHKEDLMVIIAGYEEELKKTFFSMNQGLESRFIWRFTIESYSAKELMQIFKKKVQENGWSIENNETTLAKWFEKHLQTFTYYGRDMELLFSYTKIAHGRRIYGKQEEERKKLTMHDMDSGHATFLSNKHTLSKDRPIPYGLYV